MNDDERTPIKPHARPAPVVVRAGVVGEVQPWKHMPRPTPAPRAATPLGGTLAPLGRIEHVPEPAAFTDDKKPTASRSTPIVVNRLIRNYLACSPDDRLLIEALALRLRPSAEDSR